MSAERARDIREQNEIDEQFERGETTMKLLTEKYKVYVDACAAYSQGRLTQEEVIERFEKAGISHAESESFELQVKLAHYERTVGSIDDSKYRMYENITRRYRSGEISHKKRIELLKLYGISGEENIEFDNKFREIEDANIKLDSFDPDINDEEDLKDFFDTRGNR